MSDWTPEMDDVLKAGWRDGLPDRVISDQIAALVGKRQTRSSIASRRRRLKLPMRDPAVRRETLVLTNQTRGKNFPAKPAAEAKFGPAPPKGVAKMAAFEPLPGTKPRCWTTRKPMECAWPVGGAGAETLSCCAPVSLPSAYCQRHRQMRQGAWS